MKAFEYIAFLIFVVGSTVGITRYLYGVEFDPVVVERAQLATECLCTIGILSMLCSWARNLKKTNARNLIYYGSMVGIIFVISVAFPDLNENPSAMRSVGIFVGLTTALVAFVGVPYYVERKRRKAHPDGYFHKFNQAMREARNGATVESQTGRTIRMGGDGHLVFDAPLDVCDTESLWRTVEEKEESA